MSKTKFEQDKHLEALNFEKYDYGNSQEEQTESFKDGANFGYEYGKNEERERFEKLKKDNEIIIEAVNYYADWNNHGPKGYAEAREALKKIGVT